mmetsp:Transcript_43186/g.104547  ORF Transcript_43186/g.104547 Transcript_43186/m.104547 type:complete len:277 (+) Transcript_43186:3308-4138(+)
MEILFFFFGNFFNAIGASESELESSTSSSSSSESSSSSSSSIRLIAVPAAEDDDAFGDIIISGGTSKLLIRSSPWIENRSNKSSSVISSSSSGGEAYLILPFRTTAFVFSFGFVVAVLVVVVVDLEFDGVSLIFLFGVSTFLVSYFVVRDGSLLENLLLLLDTASFDRDLDLNLDFVFDDCLARSSLLSLPLSLSLSLSSFWLSFRFLRTAPLDRDRLLSFDSPLFFFFVADISFFRPSLSPVLSVLSLSLPVFLVFLPLSTQEERFIAPALLLRV